MISNKLSLIQIILIIMLIENIESIEDGYIRYVKDGCFIKGEALSCVKYKALKIAKRTLFGDNFFGNETIKANQMISFVPLDTETVEKLSVNEQAEVIAEPKGFLSEWAELAKYFMKLMKEFLKVKGLRVDLPEGARTIEEDDMDEDGGLDSIHGGSRTLTQSARSSRVSLSTRGKKKKLAIVVPLLTLLAAMKTKLLLIPILLSVLLIKKLLLVAALLLPSLLNTLKACKVTTLNS
ncbi:hypothetical protein ACJJTC_014150 [Scirpophaga incertulas]